MNKQDYDKYYQQGGQVDNQVGGHVQEVKMIDKINELVREVRKLKEKL